MSGIGTVPSQMLIVRPVTRHPARFSSQAATDESTPPLRPMATLVFSSCIRHTLPAPAPPRHFDLAQKAYFH